MAGLLLGMGQAHALGGDTIDRWIAAMGDLQQWAEQHGAELEDDMDVDAAHPGEINFERMMNEFARRHDDVQRIVRRHGFGDTGEWANISGRVFNAYMAVKMGDAVPEMERQMQQALREMEENANIPEEHKEMMRQQMAQQRQVMTGFSDDVSDEDMRAVRAREADLDSFFEAEF